MNKEIEQAIQYVRDNKSWDKTEELAALTKMDRERVDLYTANDRIYCEIHDLMNAWFLDNGFDDGDYDNDNITWLWATELSEDDIFFNL